MFEFPPDPNDRTWIGPVGLGGESVKTPPVAYRTCALTARSSSFVTWFLWSKRILQSPGWD